MKKLLLRVLTLALSVYFGFGCCLTAFAENARSAAQPSPLGVTGDFDTAKTAMQIASEMQIGWNLGNTLDATDGSGIDCETAWGNPKTTGQMILDVKAMGFHTIRIPVSWGVHADAEGNVDPVWMARVKEVVDYAYQNDLYVILNSHHDNSFYDVGGCVSQAETFAASKRKMAALWTQIAETFKDYDERLVFETMNEPRTEGSEKEWTGGTKREREIIYGLNCAIVEAIRATGGNNAYRSIMMPTYAATSMSDVLRDMQLPDDDRIIVSVHAYLPYAFAMDANGSSAFTTQDQKELDTFFADLNRIFIRKGIPVVIGEFGATNKGNADARRAWAEYYIKGAGQYGIPCVVWDNNIGTNTGAECFGLYDRQSGNWVFPELAESMVKAAGIFADSTDAAAPTDPTDAADPSAPAEQTTENTRQPILVVCITAILLAVLAILIGICIRAKRKRQKNAASR